MSSVMSRLSPQSTDPVRNSTSATCRTSLRPYMSPSFPATGVVIVEVSRYAVTTQKSLSIPPRSPAIVGSAVDTIVESSDAINITSIRAPKIGPMRTDGAGAAPACATAVTRPMMPGSGGAQPAECATVHLAERPESSPPNEASVVQRARVSDGRPEARGSRQPAGQHPLGERNRRLLLSRSRAFRGDVLTVQTPELRALVVRRMASPVERSGRVDLGQMVVHGDLL